jgi:hypothetical protein
MTCILAIARLIHGSTNALVAPTTTQNPSIPTCPLHRLSTEEEEEEEEEEVAVAVVVVAAGMVASAPTRL